MGVVLKDLGRLTEAITCFRDALQIRRCFPEAYNNLGIALAELGRIEEAEACYKEAIKDKSDYVEAYNNLGIVQIELGRFSEAVESYKFALSLKPDYVDAQNNLASAFKECGQLTEALSLYCDVLNAKPSNAVVHSNFLLCQNYFESTVASNLLDQANGFGLRVSEAAKPKYHTWETVAKPEKLKIAFVSGDLRNHPVGHFIEGLINEIDQTQFELYVYSTTVKSDDLTQRIKPLFKNWVYIGGLSDQQAAKLIHEQSSQILIDLAGHTANNRLPAFAYKPAPIQVTWLGYFATTGLPEMDYILANPHVIPVGEEWHFREKVWRLPETSLCFTPPALSLEVSSLPALTNGYITFGSFNNLTKMNEKVISVWAEILKRQPESKLYLKSRQYADQLVANRTLDAYEKYEISQDRILLEGPSKREDYLSAYNRIDIALDPFPFPGGTTSVEGLWMGVPVLTLKGDRFISHQGEAIARNVGLPDWISEDTGDYVAKAVRFSADLQSLATLRSALRAQLLNSPLCDAKRFARHFEEAMWGMWDEYRKGKAS